MYHKKYGRITCSAWIELELRQSSLPLAIACGVVMAALCIAVGSVTGSLYRVILELGIADLMPPVWLFSLLRFLALFLAGCAAGLMLGCRDPLWRAEKYRCGMLFLIMAAAELCWLPTLFGAGWVLLSALEAMLMLGLAVCITACTLRISRLAGYLFLMHGVWLTYLLILTCSIFLRA